MPRAQVSIPTAARLSSSLRVDPKSTVVQKSIARLSRPSLLNLALEWLDPHNIDLSAPSLRDPSNADDDDDSDEEDDVETQELEGFYPRQRSVRRVRELYIEMQSQKGSRKDVADRITEGDWRHGLSLYQLAMLDFQYLYDHPGSQKWSAYRVTPVKSSINSGETLKVDKGSLVVPRFHPSTFLQRLEAQVLPDAKAHFHFDRPKNMALLLLRIFILNSPYNTDLAFSDNAGDMTSIDSSRTIMVAFPDASPYIYISKPQTVGTMPGSGDAKNMRDLIVEGIPKAFSRPPQRYTLKSTSLVSKNLDALLASRGPGRGNAAGGGWSIYTDEKKNQSPFSNLLPTIPSPVPGTGAGLQEKDRKRKMGVATGEEKRAKRSKLAAQARFGDSARADDGKGLEKVEITVQDPFPGNNATGRHGENDGTAAVSKTSRRGPGRGRKGGIDAALPREDNGGEGDGRGVGTGWAPDVRVAFHGTHIFAGMRQLVEAGIIDGKKMPGWLTGEEGVTVGTVRNGKIQGHNGSGI